MVDAFRELPYMRLESPLAWFAIDVCDALTVRVGELETDKLSTKNELAEPVVTETVGAVSFPVAVLAASNPVVWSAPEKETAIATIWKVLVWLQTTLFAPDVGFTNVYVLCIVLKLVELRSVIATVA